MTTTGTIPIACRSSCRRSRPAAGRRACFHAGRASTLSRAARTSRPTAPGRGASSWSVGRWWHTPTWRAARTRSRIEVLARRAATNPTRPSRPLRLYLPQPQYRGTHPLGRSARPIDGSLMGRVSGGAAPHRRGRHRDGRAVLARASAPTRYWFDQARQRGRDPLQTAYFRFAGRPCGCASLARRFSSTCGSPSRSYSPTISTLAGPFALTIDAWDRATTHTGCPGVPMPPDRTHLLDHGLITFYAARPHHPLRARPLRQRIDRTAGEIFTWREDGHDQALYERAKPFPIMLEVWYRDHGVQQLHAGCVARRGKGVLFIGPSGSGKSTCTLACALDGFDYLGDDHNGMQLTPDGRCLGHSFYNAARIGPTHLEHFPRVAAARSGSAQ